MPVCRKLGSRVDPVVVQDPLHRGPSDLVAEVRERPADPCVTPLWILDRHPDHERGNFASRHRPASTAAGAAVVCLGDQSPVPAENRVKRDDAGDLHQDSPSEFLAAHGASTALGIGPAKRPRAQVLPEDPILLPEIRDQIVLGSSRCVASARARASIFSGGARRPASHVRYDSGDAPSVAANAACDWPNEIRHSRSVQGALVHESELTGNGPTPDALQRSTLYDSGRPRAVIRLRTLHARSTSTACPPGLRARSPAPMIDLYRKKVFSTRAC